jgi:hypothetical protein
VETTRPRVTAEVWVIAQRGDDADPTNPGIGSGGDPDTSGNPFVIVTRFESPRNTVWPDALETITVEGPGGSVTTKDAVEDTATALA